MRLLLAASALVFAAAPGVAGQKHDQAPAATPAGDPVDCLRLSDIRETKVRNDHTIDFVTRGGKVYRNQMDGMSCPGLGFEKRFAHETTLSQLCSTDTITVLQSPGLHRGASCGLGTFQPVKLATAH